MANKMINGELAVYNYNGVKITLDRKDDVYYVNTDSKRVYKKPYASLNEDMARMMFRRAVMDVISLPHQRADGTWAE